MIDSTLYKQVGEMAEKYKDYPNIVDKSDPNNRDILIKKNMRLAVDLAMKYAVKYSLDEEDTMDLVAEGLVGLCTAYEKYNPDKQGFEGKRAKFSSVAWFWCNAAIMSASKKMLDSKTKNCELIDNIPEGDCRDLDKVEKLYEDVGEIDIYLTRLRYGVESGHSLTFKEISKLTGFRISLIKKSVATCLEKMKQNAAKYKIKWSDVFID